MYIRIAIGLMICLLVPRCIPAQGFPDLQFEHITAREGLSAPYVREIYQDRQGLMWFCTTSGLNRYDGKQFKVYRNNPSDSNSLPSDDIWNIHEDKKGNFWVGTQNGLCYFEPNENRYTTCYHQPGVANSLANVRAENVVVDDEGYVWIGSQNGLQRFEPLHHQFRLFTFATAAELASNANSQAIYQLYIDRKNQLWANAGGNLFLIDRKNLTTKKVIQKISSEQGINSIYQDTDGQYWLAYWGLGIARFDGLHPPAEKDFVTGSAHSIFFRFAEWKDTRNNNWLVITKDDGLAFYNKLTGEIHICRHDNNNAGSFGSHGGNAIMADRYNNVWIAGRGQLELLETARQFFSYHRLGGEKDKEDYYYFGTPMPVYRDGSFCWAGLWHGKGLIKLDSNWNIVQQLRLIPPGGDSSLDKTVFGIYKDHDGLLWLTTDGKLVSYEETTRHFRAYVPGDIHPDAFYFKKIIPGGNNRLFIRTRYNGVYIFNKITGRFEQRLCVENTAGFPANDVLDIATDNSGKLWVATTNGLCAVDTATGSVVEKYNQHPGKAGTLINNNCRSLEIDGHDQLWIGTENGLSRLDLHSKQFTNFTTASGLCNGFIKNMVADKNDNIWLITQNGVSVYSAAKGTFQNFFKEDGLPQNALDGTINKDSLGTVYFGDAGIIFTIDPDNIPVNNTKPPVIITDVLLSGQHCPVRLNKDGVKFIETSSAGSAVTIQFSVINFVSSHLNRYYYKLDGIDKDWQQSDRGLATYINIPPGDYLLRVKGSNNSGVMNEDGDTIRIIVKPQWFQTWWFKGLILAGIVLAVALFVRWRIGQVKGKAQLKQRIAETEMQALRAQMNPHFIFNSLNSIENFIMQNEKRLASDYLNKFARLIRMILDSSRNELVPVARDMEALQLYVDLEQLRFNHKFIYESQVDAALVNGDYRVPSLIIQPYVENAIVHGLSHSEKQGLKLSVSAQLVNEQIKYIITDNGVGRQQAAAYNQQNKPHHKSVGLQITAERVNMFNRGEVPGSSVHFTDLYNEDGTSAGTRVEITIKAT